MKIKATKTVTVSVELTEAEVDMLEYFLPAAQLSSGLRTHLAAQTDADELGALHSFGSALATALKVELDKVGCGR